MHFEDLRDATKIQGMSGPCLSAAIGRTPIQDPHIAALGNDVSAGGVILSLAPRAWLKPGCGHAAWGPASSLIRATSASRSVLPEVMALHAMG